MNHLLFARGRTSAAVVLVLVMLGSRAEAQEACGEGRVRSADTAGRCCWPGQSWASDLRRCEGPPTCPVGLVAEGDSCVPSRTGPVVGPTVTPQDAIAPAPMAAPARPGITPLVPPSAGVVAPPPRARVPPRHAQPAQEQPTQAPPTPPQYEPAAAPPVVDPGPAVWPIAPTGGPAGLHNPRWVEASSNEGLVIAGAVLLGAGYIEQVGMAIGRLADDGTIYRYSIGSPSVGVFEDFSCRNTTGGTLFIPFVGVIVAGIVNSTCTVPYYGANGPRPVLLGERQDESTMWWAAGIPGAVLQVLGLVLLSVGVQDHPRSVQVDPGGLALELGGARLALTNGAPSADLGGLSLRLEL